MSNTITIPNGGVLSNAPVTGDGVFVLFESAPITTPTSTNSLQVVWNFDDLTPDGTNQSVSYSLKAVLERETSSGTWVPFWTQPLDLVIPEQGTGFILEYGPHILNFSPEQAFDMSDGQQIVSHEYTKQGHLPDTIRFCVLVRERGFNNTPGTTQFQSVKVSASYDTLSS